MTTVHEPASLQDAVALLGSLGPDGAILAGGTWVMRAPLRNEGLASQYVSLRRLDELRGAERQDGLVRIGALATHRDIAELEDGAGPLGALAEAARRSAFPAVRNVATLGGNLAAPFSEADLVPPLLAGDATLEVALPEGTRTPDVAAWLHGARRPDALIIAVRVPVRSDRRSWFERITVRAAEYSIVSVALSVDVGRDGMVTAARLAVGAVQDAATRVPAAEAELVGGRLDDESGEAAGRAAAQALTGRDGLDAPGWYRLAVVPPLVRRAVAHLAG